jgi:hypothetical protein
VLLGIVLICRLHFWRMATHAPPAAAVERSWGSVRETEGGSSRGARHRAGGPRPRLPHSARWRGTSGVPDDGGISGGASLHVSLCRRSHVSRISQSKTYGHLASTGSRFSGDTTGSLSLFWPRFSPMNGSRRNSLCAARAAGRTACALLAANSFTATRRRTGCTRLSSMSGSLTGDVSSPEPKHWRDGFKRQVARLTLGILRDATSELGPESGSICRPISHEFQFHGCGDQAGLWHRG